jgi:soluble lytic murein transglycosylase-like protein
MSLLRRITLVFGFLVTIPALGSDIAVLRNGFSIRHERREVLGTITRLYLAADNSGYVDVPTENIDRFEKDLLAPVAVGTPVSSQSIKEVINSISSQHHLDPDLIKSVIHAESGFNPRAVSPRGAQGLMQLMPQTASQMGVANSFDPKANVEGGIRYLRQLLERYNFDLIKALAAYNAGPQRVDQYQGVPPYYETQAYVARIVRDFNRKKLAEQKAAQARAQRAPSHPALKQASLP